MLTRIDLKNTISLVGAEGISRGLALILTIFIARELGVLDFGLYSTAISFVFLFSTFIEIGLSTYVYRESSKDNDASTKYITSALVVQIILAVVVGGVVFVTAIILNYPPETRALIYLLWFWMIGISLGRMIRVVFKAHQRMELDAFMNVFENGSRFILVLLALHMGFGVVGVAFASIISSFLMLVASALLATSGRYLHFTQMQWDTTFMINLLKAAFPFALSMIAAVMMYRVSIVILSVIKGDYDVGIFDASFKLTVSLFFIPGLICNAFFPKLSQFAVTNNAEYAKTIILLLRSIFLLMYPLLMVIYIFAPELIGVIYTADFLPTISVLRILVWVNFFNSGAYIGIYALNAANYENRVMTVMFTSVSIKAVISIILIIWADYTGAAIGALISEIVVTTLLLYYLQQKKNISPLPNILAKIIVITMISFGVIIFTQWLNFNHLITLVWFASSFIIAVMFSHLVTTKDIINLRQLLLPSTASG